MTNLLDHLRPLTLAQLVAELIDDHADVEDIDGFIFRTDEARAAYHELLEAGIRNCGRDEFFSHLDAVVDLGCDCQ